MKQTVTESMFIDSFCGGYKDNFSYEGKKALFEWLEELDDDGHEMELDPIAFCCEFTEYESTTEAAKEFGADKDINFDLDPDDVEAHCDGWLEDRTIVINHEKGIIIQDF